MNYLDPNFFIIGAPKCGTTALSRYLDSHPEILFAYPKEPNYFNTDFDRRYRRSANSYDEYKKRFFATKKGNYKCIGEGTVWYLMSETAVGNILEINPEAKFIVMLRNPVDLAHALHSTELFCSHETIPSFEEAWDLRVSQGLPLVSAKVTEPKILQYGEVACLGKQVKRLLQTVPRHQCHFILFEDFIEDTRYSFQQVCSFLGISSNHQIEFLKINSNRSVKNKRFMQFLNWTSRKINITNIKKSLGIANRKGLLRTLKQMNSRPTERSDLSEQFKLHLIDYFSEDIKLLEEQLSLDLKKWYE